jgi:hypothetical protein
MAVNPEYANQLLSDFQEQVEGIVRTNGLEHHMGTANLSDIDSVKDMYINTVMNTFTLPHTTEGELQSEMNVALVEIKKMARSRGKQEASQIAGIGSTINKMTPADSNAWNTIIADAGHRIDKLVKLHADQINNMPKPLRARIDDDFAKVLDAINDAYNANPSTGNAQVVQAQVTASLDKIEKDLAEASNALLKASIEAVAHQKMTQLQEKKFAIQAVEAGMTKGQIDSYRALVKEIETLIHELGRSNFLVYDKVIRGQKVANIDNKMAILETLRINAAGVSSALSGYFGNSNSGRRGMSAIGGVGTTLGMNTSQISAAPKNFRNGVPPGFAGYSGTMTREDIAKQHPPGTAKAHIDAMEHYMSEGMSFNDAHNRANAEGYTPQNHNANFGGGAYPFR